MPTTTVTVLLVAFPLLLLPDAPSYRSWGGEMRQSHDSVAATTIDRPKEDTYGTDKNGHIRG
jgi:hypothetical protein